MTLLNARAPKTTTPQSTAPNPITVSGPMLFKRVWKKQIDWDILNIWLIYISSVPNAVPFNAFKPPWDLISDQGGTIFISSIYTWHNWLVLASFQADTLKLIKTDSMNKYWIKTFLITVFNRFFLHVFVIYFNIFIIIYLFYKAFASSTLFFPLWAWMHAFWDYFLSILPKRGISVGSITKPATFWNRIGICSPPMMP